MKSEFQRERYWFELRKLEIELAAKVTVVPPSSSPSIAPSNNISKYVRMVPPFSEREVDRYFPHFERLATCLKWPMDTWTLLLQCVLVGRAQDVYASLSIEQSMSYDTVNSAILCVIIKL